MRCIIDNIKLSDPVSSTLLQVLRCYNPHKDRAGLRIISGVGITYLGDRVPTNPAFARITPLHLNTPLMAPCFLCNDLQDGEGGRLPIEAWIANILDSVCPYCQLLVEAAKELNPDLLSPESSAQANPDIELQVRINEQGKIYVTSDWLDRCGNYSALEFFRSAQDVELDGMLNVPVRGEIAALPGDPTMWPFLRSCLSICLAQHSGCAQQQDHGWFPERVVSIRQGSEGNPLLRLVIPREQPTRSTYIALSHCWGSESFPRTTTSNLRSHRTAISYSSLPRTFQDAITVALEMDVALIWINSLCIIQDDVDDWARHAEQMDMIYQHALFVVPAVSSSAASVPFLGPDAPADRYSYRTVHIKTAAIKMTQATLILQ
jgi:hypothetical protein